MIRLGAYPGLDLSNDPYVVELRRQLWEYLRRPPAERAQRRAPIEENFYFSSSIALAVTDRCLGKCVFCERDKDLVRSQVETFRPIREAWQPGGDVAPDHYAWLAYETDNLVLVCVECIGRRQTEFPLKGPRAPYLAAFPEVRRRERPLVVDPYRGQPSRHFIFLADGRCQGATVEGQVTTALFGLSEGKIVEQRRRNLDKMLQELRAAVPSYTDFDCEQLLRREQPFAGARLGLTKRLFDGVEIGGTFLRSSMSLPQQLTRAFSRLTSGDRERLAWRIDQLVDEDRARRFDRDLHTAQRIVAATPPDDRSRRRSVGWMSWVNITEFKGIEQLHIEVPLVRERSRGAPCLMLLGENSVGKSSVLQAIALAMIGGREVRRLRLDSTDLFRTHGGERWDQLTPKDARVEVGFGVYIGSAAFQLDASSRRVVGSDPSLALVLGYGPRRYFDPRKSERPDADHNRVRTLFDSTAALPFPGTWLNELDDWRFNEVAKVLRVVLSLRDSDELVRDVDGRICVSLAGNPIPVERLSEGYRSVFALVADIVRELTREFRHLEDAEAIVLIDEIETHLHPRWKMRVMSALRQALPRVQFVVTTHDPLCLRGMDDGEVVVLQRDNEGRIIILKNLPSIKGMRADQLLTSDYFGLSSTIDPETELDVARFVSRLEELPTEHVDEANEVIRQLVLGDSALEQVVQEALVRFLAERERPRGALRTDVRTGAVQAIIAALEDGGAAEPSDEPFGA